MKHGGRLLAVIPVHDEAASIGSVVAELRRQRPDVEILVVDDASVDDTPRVLADLRVLWLRLGSRLGIGGAVRAGLRYAVRHGYPRVVRLDGDGQHAADGIAGLEAPLREGVADVVLASRYQAGAGYRTRGLRRVGQRALAALIGTVTGWPITDPTSGLWAFGPRAVRMLSEHHPTGYPEPELLLFLYRNRLRVAEVPVQMRQRLAGSSTLTAARELHALTRVLLALIVVPIRRRVEDRERVRDRDGQLGAGLALSDGGSGPSGGQTAGSDG